MLELKGKLRRLDGGMPRYDFWEMVKVNAQKNSVHYNTTAVRQLCATAHRVRDAYVPEVAAWAQMLCDNVAVTKQIALVTALRLLDLTPIRLYDYEGWNVALETNRFWIAYPANVRHVNRLLSRRKI